MRKLRVLLTSHTQWQASQLTHQLKEGEASLIQSSFYLWPGFFLLGVLFIADSVDSVLLLTIDLFIFPLSFWFSLGRLYISRNLSISNRFPSYWCVIIHSNLLWFLCFCGVSCNFSSFISDFISLYLHEFGLRFTNFAYLFKEPVLRFIELFYFFTLFLLLSLWFLSFY